MTEMNKVAKQRGKLSKDLDVIISVIRQTAAGIADFQTIPHATYHCNFALGGAVWSAVLEGGVAAFF